MRFKSKKQQRKFDGFEGKDKQRWQRKQSRRTVVTTEPDFLPEPVNPNDARDGWFFLDGPETHDPQDAA